MWTKGCFVVIFYAWICSLPVAQVTGGQIIEPNLPFPQIQCFFTSWSRYRDAWAYTPANVEPFLCTTIVYAFAQILDDRIALYDWKDDDNLRDLVALKQINPNLRIHLSVGGWSLSYQFRPTMIVPDSRQNFINSTVDFLRAYDLDGIDIDWEYPEAEDRDLYTAVVQELRLAFDEDARSSGKRRLALTVDVGAVMHDGYDVPAIEPSLDLVNIMAYDYHGSWEQKTGHNAPLYPRPDETDYQAKMNVIYSATLWVQVGIPKSKLSIGIPTYGRTWTLRDAAINGFGAPTAGAGPKGTFSKELGSLAYFEICDRLNQRTLTPTTNHDCQCTYATDGTFWAGYDDVTSVTKKAVWIKENGYNGVLVWELGMDDFKGECGGKKSPLFSAIYDTFNNHPMPTIAPTRAPPPGATTPPRPTLKPRPTQVTVPIKPKHCDDAFCSLRPAGDYAIGACSATYCTCNGGFSYTRDCPPGIIYDPVNKVCSWPQSVPGCVKDTPAHQAKLVKEELKSCRDSGSCVCNVAFCGRHGLGDFALGPCLPNFCACAQGRMAYTKTCPVPLIYDPKYSVCNWKAGVSTC